MNWRWPGPRRTRGSIGQSTDRPIGRSGDVNAQDLRPFEQRTRRDFVLPRRPNESDLERSVLGVIVHSRPLQLDAVRVQDTRELFDLEARARADRRADGATYAANVVLEAAETGEYYYDENACPD